MPDNVVIDIDTLEIVGYEDEPTEAGRFFSPTPSWDALGRTFRNGRHYYRPSSLLWKVEEAGVTHQLHPRNKHGSYPYRTAGTDWGRIYQLSQEEALWKTLEFAPELVDFI